jgi:Flp pilus assembly pilin Flp
MAPQCVPPDSHQEALPMPDTKRSRVMVEPTEAGQTLAEYALILALIAILAILALVFVGGQITTLLSTVGQAL